MVEMIKLCFFSILIVIVSCQLKSTSQEFSLLLGIGTAICLCLFGIGRVQEVLMPIRYLRDSLGDLSGDLLVLLKVVGLTYICEFSADICKDAGFGTACAQLELLGKLSVMYAGLPIVLAVVEQLKHFL